MKVESHSLKDVSSEFEIFKRFLNQANFNTTFTAISFLYKGDDILDIKTLKIIYPQPHKLYENDKIKILSLSDAKTQLSYGFNDFDDKKIRTKEVNKQLENIFWESIGKHIDLVKAKLYYIDDVGDFTIWSIFWIIVDKNKKKGFLIVVGADD
jgi:hypothetical protein